MRKMNVSALRGPRRQLAGRSSLSTRVVAGINVLCASTTDPKREM
jgi:hypothetical protein